MSSFQQSFQSTPGSSNFGTPNSSTFQQGAPSTNYQPSSAYNYAAPSALMPKTTQSFADQQRIPPVASSASQYSAPSAYATQNGMPHQNQTLNQYPTNQ